MDVLETRMRAMLAKTMGEEGLAIVGPIPTSKAVSAMVEAFQLGQHECEIEMEAAGFRQQ